MGKSTETLGKMIELNNSINQVDKENEIIKNNKIKECPYFKGKLFCTSPDLKETKNNKCMCFDYKLKND